MRTLDPRGNAALRALALAACTALAAPEHAALAAPEHTAASTEWTWTGLAPAMGARIDATVGADEPTPAGDVPPGVREAIAEAVVATLPRVSVQFGRLTSKPLDASPGEALLAHERSARLFRHALAASLSAREIACPDCALPPRAVRDVSLLDLLPYAIAATYVGTDDMEVPAKKGAVHICVGGVIAAILPDDELGDVALAAMMSGFKADDARLSDVVRKHVRDARRDRPKGDARAVTDLYRIRLLADRAFIDALRGPLSAECEVAGLRCVDCLGTPCP